MRRRVWIAVGIAVVLVLVLRGAVWLDATGSERSSGRARVPKVIGGRDLASPAPERADADFDLGTVLCTWDGTGPAGAIVAFSDIGEAQRAEGDREVRLQLEPGTWTLTWMPAEEQSIQLGPIEVTAGGVNTCRLERRFKASGVVVNLDGKALPNVSVRGCGQRRRTEADGSFAITATNGSCRVQAAWEDGLLSRRSKAVSVGAFRGDEIELVVDDRPVAGLGIAFEPSMEGSKVGRVMPGTPAEEAGLESGDMIVAIDGQPVGGVEEDEFIAMATGDEGTRVELTVDRDGERRTLTVTRERIVEVDTGG